MNLSRQETQKRLMKHLNADFRPLRLEKLRLDHEENQRKTEDFFTKSQNVLKQWFSPDSKEKAETESETDSKHSEQNEGVASDAIEAIEETISPPPNKVPKGNPPGILSVMSSHVLV